MALIPEPRSIEISICRICIQSVQRPTYLFSDDKHSKEILDKIFTCFQYILKYKEYFPSVICKNCILELNNAYNFHQNCKNFEKRFLAVYQENLAQIKSNNEGYKSHETLLENYYDVDSQGGLDKIDDDHTIIVKDEINISNTKHVNKDGYFSCPICKKELKTEESLTKHKISMHQKRKHVGKITGYGVNRRYHCTKCPYNTPHSQTLVNHVRKHNGDRPFHCECGKSFSQSSSLNAHRKTHSNTTYFTCSICGKQFKHAFSLKKHLDVHEIGKYECEICHKQLKSRQTLQDHMYRHYNIRNYNCEDCGSTFVTHSELLNHKRRHSIIKSVECHLCGYKTHTKKSLILHLKRHAGDKAYKCDLCHLSFFISSDLQRHKRVHTREKPFPCPACTQKFTHSPSLNKHLKSVHGINWKWSDIKMKILNKEKILKDLQGRLK